MNKKYLSWRLDVVMAERKIKTVTELHRMLVAHGVKISSAQLSRIVQQKPQRINTELLDGLINILNCTASDILQVEEETSMREQQTTPQNLHNQQLKKQKKASAPKIINIDKKDLTGPKVSAFPVAKKSR